MWLQKHMAQRKNQIADLSPQNTGIKKRTNG